MTFPQSVFVIMWIYAACLFTAFGIIYAQDLNTPVVPYGLLADGINKTLINIASKLGVIEIENFPIASGEQEFGAFNLILSKLNVTGLDALIGEIINVQALPMVIRNLTIYVPYVSIEAKNYELTGHLIFPIGNKVIPLTGSNGYLRFGMTDLRISMYVKPYTNTSGVFIDDVRLETTASAMTLDAENLMGGGDIGWAFNTVLNDVVIVAYDYYKDAIITQNMDKIKHGIQNVICQLLPLCK